MLNLPASRENTGDDIDPDVPRYIARTMYRHTHENETGTRPRLRPAAKADHQVGIAFCGGVRKPTKADSRAHDEV